MDIKSKKGYYFFEDWARRAGLSAPVSFIRFILSLVGLKRGSTLARAADFVTHCPRLSEKLGVWKFIYNKVRLELSSETGTGQVTLCRSALLKPYVSPDERGILLVSFESELEKLVKLPGFHELEKKYKILFLPTWQPFHSLVMFKFNYLIQERHAILPSSLYREEDLVREFSEKLEFLPFHAASWVASHNIETIPEDRDIDFLMVANFARHKRHWRLFKALGEIEEDVKVVVAGMPRGRRDETAILREAALFGVEDRVEVLAAPSDEKISELLCRARIFCAMTHKEGSFISVAEALMHGVSVVMFKNAYIGTRDYINGVTGRFLSERENIGTQLMKALQQSSDPRTVAQWAAQNISADVKSSELNEMLKEGEVAKGKPWTTDIESFYCSHFEFYIKDKREDQKLEAEYEKLNNDYGLSFRRAGNA